MRRVPTLLIAVGALVALASASCTPDPKLALRSANDPQLPPGQPGIRLTVGSSSSEAASAAGPAKDAGGAAKAASAAVADASAKGGDSPTSVLVIHADAENVAAIEKALK